MNRGWAFAVAICASLAAALGGAAMAGAAEAENPSIPDIPVLLRADTMKYDRELGIVTASGNVEVSQEDRVLLADTVSYNQREDILTASGNITILEPTGEVLFAEHLELTGDLKDGIIEDLRLLLSDSARVAAAGGRRSAGNLLVMRNAVYSPCNLCQEDPTRPPLWQLKAIKVVHDKRTKNIEYKDAWLEFAGVPVAYTPYLSQPDPSVKRRTGFLAPSFGSSSDLGFVLRTPYFVDIAPNMDATVSPILTTKGGGGAAGEYRHRLMDGEIDSSGSVVVDSEDEVRGHLFSEGRFHIDDTWRGGFDIERATDDTYLRRYEFSGERTLTSRLFAEGYRHRNYFAANAYAFQGLREDDDPGQTPLVMPMIDFNHVGEADRYGGRTSLDANLLALSRAEGTDSRRLSLEAGWRLPHVDSSGAIFELSSSLRGDLYHVNGLDRDEPQGRFSGITGRLVPRAALEGRFPVSRQQGTISQVIEPVVQFVVSPFGGNPNDVPNEDSRDFEFDDTNLFTANRFVGFDRVEGGPRVNYGVKWGVFGGTHGSTTLVIGQSYRFKTDDTFEQGSGLEDNASDVVAKLHVAPGSHLDIMYRTQLDDDNLEARRNELNLRLGPSALRLSADYLFFNGQQSSGFPDREEINFALNAQLTRRWRSKVSVVNDLDNEDGGLRSAGLSLTYEDECFVFSASAKRTFFQDRDLRPTDSVLLRLTFKTLGDVQTAVQ